jgi:ketosteroid isomerase-like protein
VFFLLLPFTYFASGQSSSSRQEQVMETVHEIARAWDTGDVTRLGELVLNDYHGISIRGRVMNKGQLLTFVRNAPRGESRQEEESLWVRGDVAVYTAKVTDTVTDAQSKKDEVLVTRVTDVLVRDGNDWKLQQSQETLLGTPGTN